jgi:hypothetical protein
VGEAVEKEIEEGRRSSGGLLRGGGAARAGKREGVVRGEAGHRLTLYRAERVGEGG